MAMDESLRKGERMGNRDLQGMRPRLCKAKTRETDCSPWRAVRSHAPVRTGMPHYGARLRTKNIVLADERVAVPSLLQTGMAVTIGAECYVAHSGFSFLYDSVVVTAQ
jgi:hypothetical protein